MNINCKKSFLIRLVLIGLLLVMSTAYADNEPGDLAYRPFGEARTRYNLLNADRTPILARPNRAINKNALIPPRTRRQGFIPRLSITEEYNDNILFDSGTKVKDFITRISPGFNFVNLTQRTNLELDYSFESAIYPDNSNLNNAFEAHNVFTSGSFRPTKTTTIVFFDTFFSYKDSAQQIIPGLSPRNRTNENYFSLQFFQELLPKVELNLTYNQILNQYEDKSTSTSLTHEGRISFENQFSNQDKAAAHYTYRFVDFLSNNARTINSSSNNSKNAMIHFASVSNTHEFSETLILNTEIGVAFTTHPSSSTDVVGNVSLIAPIKAATAEISYNRDIKTAGGLGSLLEIDTVSANVGGFLWNDLYGRIGLDFSRFKEADGQGLEFIILEPVLSLEYKLSKQLQFRLGYNYLYQETTSENIEIDSNRVNLGLIANF